MHMMCVRGVYVTNPAHNIIFGGKWPAFLGRFFRFVFSWFLCLFPFGLTFSLFFVCQDVSFDVFLFFFACCCGPCLGLIFLLYWAMLKIVGFSIFYKRLKLRVSLERCRKNWVYAFFSQVL